MYTKGSMSKVRSWVLDEIQKDMKVKTLRACTIFETFSGSKISFLVDRKVLLMKL